jgi:hypothetical protein
MLLYYTSNANFKGSDTAVVEWFTEAVYSATPQSEIAAVADSRGAAKTMADLATSQVPTRSSLAKRKRNSPKGSASLRSPSRLVSTVAKLKDEIAFPAEARHRSRSVSWT